MSSVRGRFSLAFAPLLALLALGFGAIQLYAAVVSARTGNLPFTLIYGLMGVGGVALAMGLWSVRRRMNRPTD
jgi:hypothetical protein